jgi:hypothetical protein
MFLLSLVRPCPSPRRAVGIAATACVAVAILLVGMPAAHGVGSGAFAVAAASADWCEDCSGIPGIDPLNEQVEFVPEYDPARTLSPGQFDDGAVWFSSDWDDSWYQVDTYLLPVASSYLRRLQMYHYLREEFIRGGGSCRTTDDGAIGVTCQWHPAP